MGRQAEKFKLEGNDHFKAGRLQRAVDLYSKAEQTDPTDPVYPSNLSAALYEIGDYAGCIDAVLRAWRFLYGKDTKPDLLVRLSNRLAKALSLGVRARAISQTDLRANEAGIKELRKAAETASVGLGNATAAEDLVRTWEEWDATAPDVKAFAEQSEVAISSLSRLPLFSKPLDDTKEYYSIGNDPIINLVDGWGSRTDRDVLNFNKLPKEKLSEMAFLFGGVGDGRHAFGIRKNLPAY